MSSLSFDMKFLIVVGAGAACGLILAGVKTFLPVGTECTEFVLGWQMGRLFSALSKRGAA